MSDVRIQIGTFERDYDLYTTTAPEDYDSASTITVYEDVHEDKAKHSRYVLVEVGMIDWHRGRYSSGLYRFEKEDVEKSMLNYIAGKLMGRLQVSE